MRTLDRRKFLTVSAGVGMPVFAAACSSGTDADSVGYSDQDTLLAFGRQPVGVS